MVTIAVPPLALDEQISGDYEQLKRLFYVFFFKTPQAEAVVGAQNMAFLDRLWADWSPGYDAAADLAYAKQCLRAPDHLVAALGYYRADEPRLYAAEHRALLQTPPQPTLYLHGERDGCIDVAIAADALTHLSPGSRVDVIDGAGHFAHVERPATVNPRILEWVAS